MNLSSFLKYVQLLFLAATILLAVCCLFGWVTIDTEHIYVLFGALPSLGVVFQEFHSRELEKFSTVNVLAVGYVKNFLNPVMTRIVTAQPTAVKPVFYIYLPADLSELEEKSLDVLVSRFKVPPYSAMQEDVRISAVLTKKIIRITKAGSSNVSYIDFPATLLSLNALIEYRMHKEKNRSGKEEKRDMAAKYIDSFKDEVINIMGEMNKTLVDQLVFIRDIKEIPLD